MKMTKNEIETKLKEMREIRAKTFPDFMKAPIIEGREISWKEFDAEEAKLNQMHREIMKAENGWYYYTPVKEVYVENGKVTVGVCRGFDGPNLMLVYKMIKKAWDNERAEYFGREIQSDVWGIYERVPEGATPEEIAEGEYLLREVCDTASCRDLEEIYAELRKENEAD